MEYTGDRWIQLDRFTLKCYSCPQTVRHPSECNTTETCGPNSLCMTKHLRAKDGHHEYMMKCESREICDLIVGGFGKRGIEKVIDLNKHERVRVERGVTIDCCGTDLCNFEMQKTSAATTTIQPTPTTVFCDRDICSIPRLTIHNPASPCEKDVVFVMQNHVTRTGHVRYGESAAWIPFVEKVVAQINAGQNKTHVAVMTFDTDIKVNWYLKKYGTSAEVNHALAQLQHTTTRLTSFGRSNNQHVLTQLNTDVLTSGRGDRPQHKNVVVVLEYGAFEREGSNFPTEVAQLHSISSNVILVSVGADPDPRHYGIATDSAHMFQVSQTARLTDVLPQIVSLICY